MKQERKSEARKNEKGAALVMALLITFLLLVASAGLLLEATTNTMNVTDATAQQQAFDAAESGIQAAVNVLRDNVTLTNSHLLDTNPTGCSTSATQPELCKANRIDYLKALNLNQSNMSATGLDTTPRFSRWIAYDATQTDRVVLGTSGNAYKLEVSDPDHTGSLVTYAVVGRLAGDNDGSTLTGQKTYGDTTNGIKVEYLPQASTQIDTTSGSASANFGSFRITKYGNGACILNNNRFELDISMSQPYFGIRVIRGYVMQNATTCGGAGTNYSTPNVRFDSRTFTLQGSQIILSSAGGSIDPGGFVDGPPPGFDAALTAPAAGSSATSTIVGTFSSPEPIRLVIRSTGYGPRGSVKQLEAVVRKNFFDGLTAPATLTLIGPNSTAACPACTPATPATSFNFGFGNSNAMEYSGQDAASTDIIPPIGYQGSTNEDTILNEIDRVHGTDNITGTPSDITMDTPAWLSTPANLDTAVKSLQQVADGSGRYFANGVTPTDSSGAGQPFGNPNGTGITFCDGDCEFTGDGGGILVVTGQLTLRGNFSFKGIIIVTGQGGIIRKGAGNGVIQGNMIVAPYVNSSVLPSTDPVSATFLAPQYDLSGGGNSTIQYNSTAINSGLVAVSNFVLGVVEK